MWIATQELLILSQMCAVKDPSMVLAKISVTPVQCISNGVTAVLCLAINTGIILCMRPANERQRYIVMLSLIGWAYTQNDPC